MFIILIVNKFGRTKKMQKTISIRVSEETYKSLEKVAKKMRFKTVTSLATFIVENHSENGEELFEKLVEALSENSKNIENIGMTIERILEDKMIKAIFFVLKELGENQKKASVLVKDNLKNA